MSTPIERVTEYLRQRKLHGDFHNMIHGIHSDPKAEPVELTADDLEAVLEMARKAPMEPPRMFTISHSVSRLQQAKLLGYVEGILESGYQAEVYVWPADPNPDQPKLIKN
jgi:hypothetical protein